MSKGSAGTREDRCGSWMTGGLIEEKLDARDGGRPACSLQAAKGGRACGVGEFDAARGYRNGRRTDKSLMSRLADVPWANGGCTGGPTLKIPKKEASSDTG